MARWTCISRTAMITSSARFNVGLPGVERPVAELLIADAEQLCPYSKATRGNIEVAVTLVWARLTR